MYRIAAVADHRSVFETLGFFRGSHRSVSSVLFETRGFFRASVLYAEAITRAMLQLTSRYHHLEILGYLCCCKCIRGIILVVVIIGIRNSVGAIVVVLEADSAVFFVAAACLWHRLLQYLYESLQHNI